MSGHDVGIVGLGTMGSSHVKLLEAWPNVVVRAGADPALRWRIGPPEVHAAQLDRIRQVMTLETVHVGLIPVDVEAAIWRYHPFAMLDGPDDYDGPSGVWVETLDQNLGVAGAELVERYRQTFRQLQAVATTGAAAAAILDRIARGLPS